MPKPATEPGESVQLGYRTKGHASVGNPQEEPESAVPFRDIGGPAESHVTLNAPAKCLFRKDFLNKR